MDQEFLEKWINQEEHAEVALVSAPITFPPIASVALSVFQAELNRAGITSRIIYSMFPTIHLMGDSFIYDMDSIMDFKVNGEFMFAHLTDVASTCSIDEFVEGLGNEIKPDADQRKLIREMIERSRKYAEIIVDACARRIIHMGARVVACSSVYFQQNASLAILRRVKEMDPSIRTIMGGVNVSSEMGIAILRNYPSADYISFGEGDETIADVCSILLGKKSMAMPYGILGHDDPLPDEIPYRMTRDLNKMCSPDYGDFFEELKREEEGFYGEIPTYFGQTYDKTIFLEGSRGCWWGEKHPCSFCSLNGFRNIYREKDPQQFYHEIREMSRLYPGTKIQLADNILSRNMIRELLPLLAADEEEYNIMAEIKPNMDFNETAALAKAGIRTTQPGIESINDHLLKLMGKGVSAIQNIALLKYCRTCGIYPIWNMMIAVPGEKREDYEKTVELIPLIHHLYPPTRANKIIFSRFSRYLKDPQKYGLELKPGRLYYQCYEGHDDLIENMGLYYRVTGGPFLESSMDNKDIYQKVSRAVIKWRKLTFSENRPALFMTDILIGLSVTDTRPVARQARYILTGLTARIYRMAWEPVSLESICRNLPETPVEEIRECLGRLVDQQIMIYLSGKYLALAVRI